MFDWIPTIDWALEIGGLARLLLATLLGAAIGYERERRDKAAGLRTVLLVCVGAEIFTEASLWAGSLQLSELTSADPGRIAAQIVTGVGFLGAGAILVHRGRVIGLTTAAAIWVAAAIGMTVGLRLYILAVSGTAAVLLTLTWVHRVEERLVARTSTTLDIRMRSRDGARERVEEILRSLEIDTSLIGLAVGDGLVLRYHVWGDSDTWSRLAKLIDEPFIESIEIGAPPRPDRDSSRGPGRSA